MVSRRYRIHGRVQGVGFRQFTCTIARELKLRGWVRNLGDGTVEALAIGSPQRLEAFEKYLAQGPSRAEVTKIEFHDDENSFDLTVFTIAEDGAGNG